MSENTINAALRRLGLATASAPPPRQFSTRAAFGTPMHRAPACACR
jgi:hypothetical protein